MKEEKLEEAKRLYESANADQKYVLESLFPELAGSEDDRIVKCLLNYFNHVRYNGLDLKGTDVDEVIVWLEKQDKSSDQIHYWTEEEIEPIISDYLRGAEHYGGMIGRLRCLKPKSLEKQGESYTKRDVDDAWLKGMCDAKRELEKQGDSPIKWNKNTKDCKPKVSHSVLMKTTHGIAEGEWQGEHWHQYRWAGIVRDTDVLSWIELSELEKQGEQKPIEWDADDDDKFFFLKARLKDYEDCIIYDEELSMCQKNDVRETTKEFLKWLDSIKERMGG